MGSCIPAHKAENGRLITADSVKLNNAAAGVRIKFTDEEALDYHNKPNPGKFCITATKAMGSQKDLSLAYSPGVAVPCLAIHKDAEKAYEYTNKGNMVAVISNGTAVLGLGNLGALGAKPVMEGKAVLFGKFAGV